MHSNRVNIFIADIPITYASNAPHSDEAKEAELSKEVTPPPLSCDLVFFYQRYLIVSNYLVYMRNQVIGPGGTSVHSINCIL